MKQKPKKKLNKTSYLRKLKKKKTKKNNTGGGLG